jgi:glycosyltransferase involved in cell wall biosynthesis
LSRAIESVLRQTYDDFEVVIVDDCSTDETKATVEEYEDDRIRYVSHDENRGASAARNTGIKRSSGEYVAFLDSDDEWHPKKLEKQISTFAETSPDVGVVYTGFYKQYEDMRELGNVPSKRGDIFEDQLMKDCVNPTSTVMVHSDCFDIAGTFNTELSARQDYDLWIRISRYFKFDFVREPLTTLHIETTDRITDDVESRINAHKNVLELVREDIDSLSWYRRRQAFGIQYYNMGRYLQKQGSFSRAKMYLVKSILQYPFNWKAATALLFVATGHTTESRGFINIKNKVKQVRNILRI